MGLRFYFLFRKILGRLRVCAKGPTLLVNLIDTNTGALFATCPVENYPGLAVEPVTDSSRYFVVRINSGSGNATHIIHQYCCLYYIYFVLLCIY